MLVILGTMMGVVSLIKKEEKEGVLGFQTGCINDGSEKFSLAHGMAPLGF